MRQRILSLLAVVLAAPAVLSAQTYARTGPTEGLLSSTRPTLPLDILGMGTVSVEITANSGTVEFAISNGGTSTAMPCTPLGSTTPVTSTGSTGMWLCPVAFARFTATVSGGNAAVRLVATAAGGSSSSSGSGTNASVGETAAAVPASATYWGVNVAGNLVGVTGVTVGGNTAPLVALQDPVTGAAATFTTDPQEDAAETDQQRGPAVLAVRRDTAAASAANGDYVTFNLDALGQLWTRSLDPCSGVAKQFIPIDITTPATTELTGSLAGASTHYYVCAFHVVTDAANDVALVDDDSDGCGSVTSGLAGGTTAAEGWNFVANGGITLGSGMASIMRTNGTNRVLCLVTGAATQLAGHIVVVAAP